MVVGCVMRAGPGKHTVSLKVAQGSADYMYIYCAVVKELDEDRHDELKSENAKLRAAPTVHYCR